MRCSVFTVLDDHHQSGGRSGGNRYESAISLAKEADRDGFHTFWVAEHHFHSGGVLPAPAVWLAAAARETRRVRLGSMVAVLTLHNPIELAEQYALVDQLSKGRLEMGLGGGYVPQELQGFGVLPSERRERFDAALPLFLAALRGDPFPVPGDPQLTNRLNVLPVQRPLPPVWMAVQRREALPFVARRGVSVAMIPYATTTGLDEVARNVREFRAALPQGSSARVGAAFHIFVGDRAGEGRRALQRYLDSRLETGSPHFRARVEESSEASTVEGLERRGLVLLGRPEEVATKVAAIEATGVTDLLGIFDFGGLPLAKARSSMRRFAAAMGLREGAVIQAAP